MKNTALHIAVINNYLLMVKVLIKNKVDLLC
jgi:ankyrin repeat protein